MEVGGSRRSWTVKHVVVAGQCQGLDARARRPRNVKRRREGSAVERARSKYISVGRNPSVLWG